MAAKLFLLIIYILCTWIGRYTQFKWRFEKLLIHYSYDVKNEFQTTLYTFDKNVKVIKTTAILIEIYITPYY